MSSATSCQECRRRHIRCDRKEPCGYCSRLGVECTYANASSERGRRRSITGSSAIVTRIQALEDTIQQLQQRLANIEDRSETTSVSSGALSSTRSAPARYNSTLNAASIVPGGSARSYPPSQLFPQDPVAISRRLADINLARSLCMDYMSNIDPLLKLMDHELIADSLVALPHTSLQGKAVLLSIFFANQACKSPVSIPEYKALEQALKDALQAANTFTRPTYATVQALALYLTCGRTNMDQAYLNSKLPVLIQLAMKLHLHRDPSELGYLTSECEHRRRLWWHIVALDVRTAEANLSKPIIQTQQTGARFPSVRQDEPLQPPRSLTSSNPSPCSLCATATIEMVHIAKVVLFPSNESNPATKSTLSDELHEDLLARYKGDCKGPDSPVCQLIMEWCKIYWARQKLLLLHYDRMFLRNVSHHESENIESDLQSCVSIMVRVEELKTDARLSRWSWIWQNCVEWDVSSIALCLIATNKCRIAIVQQAWIAIDTVFSSWAGNFEDAAHQKRWKELTTFRDWVKVTQVNESG